MCPTHLFDDEELLSKSVCLACHPQPHAHITPTTMMVVRTNSMVTPTTTPTVTHVVRVMSAKGGWVETGREQRAHWSPVHSAPLQTKQPEHPKVRKLNRITWCAPPPPSPHTAHTCTCGRNDGCTPIVSTAAPLFRDVLMCTGR